jgi:hypothetical protein
MKQNSLQLLTRNDCQMLDELEAGDRYMNMEYHVKGQ